MTALVTGGAASGKSAYAEELLCRLAGGRKCYLATMRPVDGECRRRIEKHRSRRSGMGFETVECLGGLQGVSLPGREAFLLDCVPNLLADALFVPGSPGAAEGIAEEIVRLFTCAPHAVVVTGEVFSDGVMYDTETARYLSLLGEINRSLAGACDRVVEVVCGIPLPVKGMLP